jgi:hypothetical protein
MREAVSNWRALRTRRSRSMPAGYLEPACRFASSGKHPSREIVCVKRRCSSIRCSIRSRIGGSATGVLITDNCHDTVRRWEQCAPGTSAAPEQKVKGEAGARGQPASDLTALTLTGSHRLDRTGGTRDRPRFRKVNRLAPLATLRFSVAFKKLVVAFWARNFRA